VWIQSQRREHSESERHVYEARILKVGFWLLAKLVENEAAASRPSYVRDLLENHLFVDAVFALSIEVTVPQQIQALVEDDEPLTFDLILRSFQVDCYDVWRVITSVLSTLRLELHPSLKSHLVYVEMRSFLEVFWREKSPLVDLLVRSAKEAKEHASLQPQAAPAASAESMASIAASHKVVKG
jgi:Retinoblastoma-associated protein A domain